VKGRSQVLNCVQEDRQPFPRLVRIWVERGFSGEDFLRRVMDTFGLILEVVQRPVGVKGFILLPRRWTAFAHLLLAALVSESQRRL